MPRSLLEFGRHIKGYCATLSRGWAFSTMARRVDGDTLRFTHPNKNLSAHRRDYFTSGTLDVVRLDVRHIGFFAIKAQRKDIPSIAKML
jgi:hypothetical protein